MRQSREQPLTAGEYQGAILSEYASPPMNDALAGLPDALTAPGAVVLTAGRNTNVRLSLAGPDGPVEVVVKSFRAPGWIGRLGYRWRGSKAQRTWWAASHLDAHGIGTPAPLAYLERSRGGRLIESHFVSLYQSETTCFRSELIRLFREDPECERFMTLLKTVAVAVRAMHDAGFQHNDLGNQNIMLRYDDGAWRDVQFLDLNRGRRCRDLSWRQRGRDISRLDLPSDLMRVFREMYCDEVPPGAFIKWEERYRRWYAVHANTRRLRHPLRVWRRRHVVASEARMPPRRDMWIWDERSAQAIPPMRSKERSRYYPWSRGLSAVAATLAAVGPVWREYRRLMAGAYARRVPMAGRVGVAVDPTPERWARERDLFLGLPGASALVRFYHHEPDSALRFRAACLRELHDHGCSVSVALVQDRRATLDPESWCRFARLVVEEVGAYVEAVEVGHAINRVKWGLWSGAEHRRLLEGVFALKREFPDVHLVGPAAIDFEYPFLLAALRRVPRGQQFDALSHHLYVDRRGAPENRQGRFATLEKAALARAIATVSPHVAGKLIISEVNWPLAGTGVYSPVGSPYVSPGPRFNDPSVSEDAYGNYMLRFLLITLTSGMADAVIWWRLVARGFGLIDDTDSAAWRPRPAYTMLATFLAQLGQAEFAGKDAVGPEGRIDVYRFDRLDGGDVMVVVTAGADATFEVPARGYRLIDAMGADRGDVGSVTASGRPVYLVRSPARESHSRV